MVSGARGKSCSGAVRTLASLHAASDRVHVLQPHARTHARTGLPSEAAAVVSGRYKESRNPKALWCFTANRKTKPHSRDGKP